jgi:hypothetical protein
VAGKRTVHPGGGGVKEEGGARPVLHVLKTASENGTIHKSKESYDKVRKWEYGDEETGEGDE